MQITDDFDFFGGPGGAVAVLHPLRELPCPRRILTEIDGAFPELPAKFQARFARAPVEPPRQQRPVRISGGFAAITAPRVVPPSQPNGSAVERLRQ